MEPDLVLTLIHGTYAHDASWVKTGSLYTALSDEFGERLKIESFTWSGGNSVFERMAAAIELGDHIENLRIAHPSARQFLAAHSHGGNVACYALERLNGDHNVWGLACLATPFLHARTRDAVAFSAKNWQMAIFGLLMLVLWINWRDYRARLVVVRRSDRLGLPSGECRRPDYGEQPQDFQ